MDTVSMDTVTAAIMADPDNQSYTEQGIAPLFWAPKTARILIIGQAPGLKAQESRKFFWDRSGDRLRDWMGVTEEAFYNSGLIGVVPMDFYYPGKGKSGDLPPRKGFAKKWHAQVLQEMPDIALILLVGTYAQDYYLTGNPYRTLTETVQHYKDFLPQYFPIVHPSPLNQRWLKKNPWFEETVLPDLKTHVRTLMTKEKTL